MPSNLTIRPLGQLVAALSRYGQQLYQPPNDTIRGIELSTWYSPLQPVKPIAPEGTEPRGFQYWAGQNLLWTPRTDAEYSAARLKQLASYPLARIAIENVKDALCKANWEIQPRPKPGEPRKAAVKRGFDDQNLLKLSRFFEAPDREHSWPEWLRPLLEDMLVIDAWTILIRKTFKGEIVELPTLRGESIVRYIDDNGFTPMPPDPAYAQNWWGIPLVNLTTDQCIYKPRNIVPRNTIASQLYGMSPTEQLAPEIEIGMKRLEFTLAYYTEGSIPGVVQVVPRGISPDKITEAMQWMNSELAGNLSARRQWRMVQGFQEPGKTDQIIFAKEPLLTDAFDDKHIRNIFFGYGVSPQRILKAMNRASAEASQEASEIEGLLPYFASLKSLIDHVIQRKFNYPDYEMVFDPFTEPDPEKEANRLKMLVSTALMTLNEGRAKLGEDARKEPEADQLGVITGSGFIPLGSQGVGLQPGEAPPNVSATEPGGPGKKPGDETAGEGDEAAKPVRGKQPAGPRKPASGNKSDGHGLALEASASPAPRDIGFVSSAVIAPPVAPPVAPIELEKYSPDQERVPAGGPGGGEFAGGRSESTGESKPTDISRFDDGSSEIVDRIAKEYKVPLIYKDADKFNHKIPGVKLPEDMLTYRVSERDLSKSGIGMKSDDLLIPSTNLGAADNANYYADYKIGDGAGRVYVHAVLLPKGTEIYSGAAYQSRESSLGEPGQIRIFERVPAENILGAMRIKSDDEIPSAEAIGRWARNLGGKKLAKYSEDQEREPAGSPEGGRFAGGDSHAEAAERPKGRGPQQAEKVETFTDNRGVKTQLLAMKRGGNLNTDIIRDSVFKDDAGVVRVAYNVEHETLFFPNAGLRDADHGNFSEVAAVHQDPDLTTVRGTMDLRDHSILWYDMTSEAETIARNAGMLEERAKNIVSNNLKAAIKSTFYVDGRRVKHDTEDINSILGFKVLRPGMWKYSEDRAQVEKKQKTIPRDRPAIRPGRLASASILGKLRLERVLQKRFKTMRRKTVKLTAAALKLPHEHLEKYSEDQVRDERGRWTDGGGSFESRDPGSKIEAEIDKNHKVDTRFAPMVQEMRDRQVEAVLAYLHGAKPLAEHDDGKYRVVIMNDAERSEFTFKEGDPHPVPSGKWMDFHDDDIARQGYDAKEYRALPEAKRAEIDAKIQVERYVAAQYEDNREAFYHPKEHEAKWWAGKAAQDFVKVSFGYLVKASADKTARQILDALATEWEYVAREAEGPLVDAALAGASIGGLQLDISSVGMLDSINTVARGWAVDRAAELVGMQRTEEGRLIPNPDARWAITDTTRDELRDVITGLFDTEGELSLRDVETAIEDAGIFSDTRATMIARTEISRTQTEGNREAWRQSGLVEKVDVILSAMHDLEDECDEAAAGSPYDLDDAPEIPLHPNCECALVLAEIGEQTEEE